MFSNLLGEFNFDGHPASASVILLIFLFIGNIMLLNLLIAILSNTYNMINAKSEDCLMIGDNLEADIAGAKNAGIDHVFYNPDRKVHKEQVTFEISELLELTQML